MPMDDSGGEKRKCNALRLANRAHQVKVQSQTMSSRIKELVNDLLLRIKIALALSIISNTPSDKTAVQYAEELREAILKQWRNEDDPFESRTAGRLLLERMHLRHQQQVIAKKLSSLIPSTDVTYHCTASNSLDSGYDSCDVNDGGMGAIGDSEMSSQFSDYENPLDFSENIRKTIGANLDFIRGIVRLQNLTGNDAILGPRFDTVVKEINGLTSDFGSQTGSQNTSSEGRLNYKVASSVVQYNLETTSAETIVKKSVQEVLRHLCGIALEGVKLPYVILNWEGSLLQQSVAVIRKLSDDKKSQKAIVTSTGGLATVLITHMLKNYGPEKNITLENQVTILLQLCGNSAICSEVLKILTNKINQISAKNVILNQSKSKSMPCERMITFENCYYIFNLTEKLLTSYFITNQSQKTLVEASGMKCSEEKKLTDLWKNAWEKNEGSKTFQNKPCLQSSDNRKLPQLWCVSLENAAKVFSLNYPLITICANNCIDIIVANQENKDRN